MRQRVSSLSAAMKREVENAKGAVAVTVVVLPRRRGRAA